MVFLEAITEAMVAEVVWCTDESALPVILQPDQHCTLTCEYKSCPQQHNRRTELSLTFRRIGWTANRKLVALPLVGHPGGLVRSGSGDTLQGVEFEDTKERMAMKPVRGSQWLYRGASVEGGNPRL